MRAGFLDHIVVGGPTLQAAVDHVEDSIGLGMGGGGAHPAMGTHNRLLSLGAEDYLEALAVDAGAPHLMHRRWFGLDDFTGAPRLVGWALRVADLDAALAIAAEGAGSPLALRRGRYRWRISHPAGGVTPFDGLWPALIEWQGEAPAPDLDDIGARLVSLTLSHPKAGQLGWALSQLTEDDRIIMREGPVGMRAVIHTPAGERVLT